MSKTTDSVLDYVQSETLQDSLLPATDSNSIMQQRLQVVAVYRTSTTKTNNCKTVILLK
jgi:hypothetical protein